MKIGLFVCIILGCAMPVTMRAQAVKPELQPLAFNKLDKNHDGKLSQLEARADPELSAEFDGLDANRDGYLSMKEFQAWHRAKQADVPDPATAPSGSSGAQHMPQD